MTKRFRWDDWNRDHITKHRVSLSEAEYVVRQAHPPYPRATGDEKYLVWGQTAAGRHLQVIYIVDSDAQLDYESMRLEDILLLADDQNPSMYVIHARDLSSNEKRAYRRRLR